MTRLILIYTIFTDKMLMLHVDIFISTFFYSHTDCIEYKDAPKKYFKILIPIIITSLV